MEEKMRVVITDVLGNRKITAIKAVRAATGLGLREAKEVIDTAISGVPSVLEGISGENLRDFRKSGIFCHVDNDDHHRQFTATMNAGQLMKDLATRFTEEDRFKSAEFILKALVSYERGE
jgi:hypothetical protein